MQVATISPPAPVAAPLPAPGAPAAPTAAFPLPATLEITYSFDKELNQIIFTLRRPDTGQVVRQVPPRAILEFAAYIMDQTAPAVDVKISRPGGTMPGTSYISGLISGIDVDAILYQLLEVSHLFLRLRAVADSAEGDGAETAAACRDLAQSAEAGIGLMQEIAACEAEAQKRLAEGTEGLKQEATALRRAGELQRTYRASPAAQPRFLDARE